MSSAARTWDIAADIRDARTLPAWVYSDEALFNTQRETVFARAWHMVGDRDVVRIPQQAHPTVLLEGMLPEPILLTRDAQDRLHCLSNVCTHRGNLVINEPCKAAHLRCPYHGRRFGLDGAFEHMPEFEQARDFPTQVDNLPRIPFDEWGRWLFASLNPAARFDDWIGPMRDRLAWLPFDQFVHEPARSRDYLVRANWALYVDNYLEGFHIPFVHAGLNAALDYGQYRTELFAHGNLQVGVAKGGENTFDLPRHSPDHGQSIAAYYVWLFPNIMFNIYPWGASINIVKPLAVALTKVSFITYVWDAGRMDQGAGAGLDRVEREDENIVEAVQHGVRSRLYERGRYSPTREQGVHQFHLMLSQAMNSGR